MASVTAELSLEISRLRQGLEEARRAIRGYKQGAVQDGAGVSEAMFSPIESSAKRIAPVLQQTLKGLAIGGNVVDKAALEEAEASLKRIAVLKEQLNESRATTAGISGGPMQQMITARQQLARLDSQIAQQGTAAEERRLQLMLQRERVVQQIARMEASANARSLAQEQAINNVVNNRGGGGGGYTSAMHLQNMGYQVQDFIVQVQGGQSVLRAFIQQGSQVAGAFGPWGAIIGVAIAALGTLYGVLSQTGAESQETKQALDELAKTLDTVSRELDKLAASDAARALAEHREAIEDIASVWKESTAANAAYFDQLTKTADALQDLDLANNKLAEQRALAGARTPEERDAIRAQYEDRARGIRSDREALGIQQQVDQTTFNRDRAASVSTDLGTTIDDLRMQLGQAMTERSMVRPDVASDQDKLIAKYTMALSGASVGNESDAAIVKEMAPMIGAVRESIEKGLQTYSTADGEDKRLVDAAAAEKAALTERITTIQKEITELTEQRANALRAVDDESRNLNDLRKQSDAQKAKAEAETLAAQNQRSEKQQREDEKKNEKLEGMWEQADKGAFKLMSPAEQARAVRDKLAASFGMEVRTAEDVQQGLSNSRKAVHAARASGDLDAEEAALKKLSREQDAAAALASVKGGRAELAGETTGVINMLLGRSGGDLVVSEAKQTNQHLESIRRALEGIERSTGGSGSGDRIPGFSIFDD